MLGSKIKIHNDILKEIPYTIAYGSDIKYESFNKIKSVVNIWNFDKLALEFWLSCDIDTKDKMLSGVKQQIESYRHMGKNESDIYGIMCGVIKEQLIELDNIVTKDNFNKLIDDYLLLLLEYQAIQYYLRAINKLILDKQMTDPITSQFMTEIGNMKRFVDNPYECNLNTKIVYKTIWSLVTIGSYKLATEYAEILVAFFDKMEELYLLSDSNLKQYYICIKLNVGDGMSYVVYKNKQSSRILLGECYINTDNSDKAKVVYAEIVSLFNTKARNGILKIPHWTASNRILETAIKLSRISKTTTVEDVMDIFLDIRSRLKADNITESVYESLLTIYMIKKEYF